MIAKLFSKMIGVVEPEGYYMCDANTRSCADWNYFAEYYCRDNGFCEFTHCGCV